jgi:hypothetical protein
LILERRGDARLEEDGTMRQIIALALCAALTSGCAGGAALNRQAGVRTGPSQAAHDAIVSFVQGLPAGSRLRVTLDGGQRIRGTLMKAGDTALVVQPRTRVPEPPIEIPFDTIKAVELEGSNGAGLGRSIAIGAAAGAGATLAVLMILAAIYAD